MPTEQTLFFTCPHCDERLAQVEEPDKDIHTGETYHDRRGLRAAPQGEKGLPLLQPRTLPVRAVTGHDRRHRERRDDMRLAAQAKGGFYPTPERVVDLLAGADSHPPPATTTGTGRRCASSTTCCGAGEALAQLAERMDRPNAIPIETYGVELHRDRAEEAEKRLGRALASDLFATSVANGAFGLLLLNPPYDYDSEDKRTEHAFLTQTTRYLAEGGLLAFIVPRQRLAVSARYLSTHYARMRCWAFPHPEREVFDQVVLMGYRKADPVPDAHGESMVLEWAVGEPEPMRPEQYPAIHAEDHAQRRHPVHHPHRRSRRGCCRGAAVGAVDEHGDNRHPLARQGQPHPPADAPATGTHGDAGGGGLPRQPLPGGGGAAHPGQGPHLEGRWSWWRTPRRRRSTGRSSRPRWSPWTCTTERSPTSQHRTARPKSRATRPRHPSTGKRRGLASSGRNTPYKGRKVVKMQTTMTRAPRSA